MSHLSPSVLIAPADAARMKTFNKIVGLSWAAKEVTRRRYEKFARLALIGGGGAVTPDSFADLWQLAQTVSAKLSVTCPDIFLKNDDLPGAALIGEEKPVLMITTGAARTFDAAAMTCLLAQTLTHLYCGHLPYLATCDLVAATADNLGIFKGAASLPRMFLEEWKYAAAMTADRGALWVTDDLTTVLNYLCRSAIPANNFGTLTPEALLAQGERYIAAFQQTPKCPLFHTWANLYFNLPRYALRAVELQKWAASAEYRAARGGATDADGADADADAPAYWGAFAENPADWETAPEMTDFIFGAGNFGGDNTNDGADDKSAADSLRARVKSAASTAELFARAGVNLFSQTAAAFWESWQEKKS